MTDRVPGAELYRDDHLLVRDHSRDERVAVFVGRDPDSATPTLTDARELRDALDEFLDAVECDFDE